MAYRVNPQTGQLEDENGNVVGMAPIDQMVGAQPGAGQPLPPAALAANPVEPLKIGPLAPPKPIVLQGPVDDDEPQAGARPVSSNAELPSMSPPPVGGRSGKHVEGGVTTSSRTKIDKTEQDALEREQRDVEAGKGIAVEAGALGVKKAKAEEDEAAQQGEADSAHADRLRQHTEHFNALIDEDEKKYNQAVSERSATKLEEFGAHDPAWKQIAKAVLFGLGEFAATMTKSGRNVAAEEFDRQEKEHYMLQRQKIEEADKKVTRSRQDVMDRKQSKIEGLADLEREYAANNKALASVLRAKAASLGTEAARVDAERMANAADLRSDEHAQKLGALRRVQVENRTSWSNTEGAPGAGVAGGKVTDQQRERTALFQSVVPEIKTLMQSGGLSDKGAETVMRHELDQKVAERYPGLMAMGRRLPGFMQPDASKTIEEKLDDKDKQTYQAQRKLLDVANKYITGAGQTDKEFQRRFDAAVARPGDSAQTKQQKNRDLVSLIAEFGRQGSDPGAVDRALVPSARQGGGLPAGAVMGTMNGKRGYVLNGQFVPLDEDQ